MCAGDVSPRADTLRGGNGDRLLDVSPVHVTTTAILLLLLGVCRALWPVVQSTWRRRQRSRGDEVRRVIVGKFCGGDSKCFWSVGGEDNHSGILLNAVLLHIARSVGEGPRETGDWRGKPSALFLFDPLKSDPNLVIGPECFEYADTRQLPAEWRALHERERLHRYTVVRLPTAGAWMPVGDDIELTYQRRRGNEKSTDVDYMLHLKATGPGGLQRLEEFVARCLRQYMAELPTATGGVKRFYFEMQEHDGKLRFKKSQLATTKTFDTLFFPQKEDVLRLLDHFLQKTGRFAVEGFPHKIGFLLHGPQGTGKTSFVAALAAYTGRHVISLRLSMLSTNRQLHDVFLNRQLTCTDDGGPFAFEFSDVIFLFDDVDANEPLLRCRSTSRVEKPVEAGAGAQALLRFGAKNSRVDDKIGLSTLLNVLDGMIETPSRIAVMTTRSFDGIDPALLRAGRFGHRLRMTPMRPPELLGLLGVFFGRDCFCAAGSSAASAQRRKEAVGDGGVKTTRLPPEEEERVRRCVSALAPDGFEICGAVAESMCFTAPSLDAFLDELRRSYRNKK